MQKQQNANAKTTKYKCKNNKILHQNYKHDKEF